MEDTTDLTLRLYCSCGGAWLATPLPLPVYTAMIKAFEKAHRGPGHALADAATAAAARRRAEAVIMGDR